MENQSSAQATQGTKSHDRLKLEEPNLSCADLNSEVIKNVDNIPPTSSRNPQKQRVERKTFDNEELVKYMSNLPSYLERGENLQEKAFNVGVLDWRRLEKWQYNHKQVPYRSSRSSPSSSNTSSSFSTDGSSTCSSSGHSCSPARQRMRRPTLQSHLNASPMEIYSQGVKPFVGNVGKFQDFKAASSDPLKGQQTILRAYQSFNKSHSEIKLKECKRKDSVPQIVPEIKTSLDLENYGVASRSKGKMKIQEGESRKGVEKLQEPHHNIVDHDCPEANRRSFSEVSFSKEVYNAELYSDIPHSCPLPCEDNNKHSQIEQPSFTDAKIIKFSSEQSQPSRSSEKISVSPSRGRNLEEKKSAILPANSTVIKSSEGSELKMGTVAATKVRNPSPTRRLNLGMGRMGRSSSSKDGSAIPQLSSKHVTAKSGSDACLENSSGDKPSDTSRARSSPLRRLLDPLLKPRGANSHHTGSSQKDSTPTDRACKSSDGQVESSAVHSVKVKLDLKSCRTINVDDSHHNEKYGSPVLQALLKITIKNGFPLFTFAVDNNRDVVVATMKKLSTSRKDDNSWIYTFFTIREVKKKNGWMNQGGKSKGHGYIPNVVAQMKVSDSQFSKLIRHNSMGQFSIREFVLFAVDPRQADQQTLDLQPNDELAAIVVKLPKETPRGLNKDGQHGNNVNCLSVNDLKEPLPKGRSYSNSRDDEENGSSAGSQDLFSTTVILPGGAHGLPSKGEPSPLIERWKSGGLCDCGGWDLGCRIRILANQTQPSKRSSSSKAHPNAGRFELFSQGEVKDNQPAFCLSSFKDGIFSVEFDSSLSLLQAFSICIAVLNSRKPHELSELSNLSESKPCEETTLVENDGIKAPNHIQMEVPARYASYPPLSPVGRV
uniref:DUF3527 domain-containing protein n=1 Tax=Davidia involucrata TaxID=16924 RepID=A0A5B6ZNK4_DAVIN